MLVGNPSGACREMGECFLRVLVGVFLTFLLGAIPGKGPDASGVEWRLRTVGREQHLGPGRGDGDHLPHLGWEGALMGGLVGRNCCDFAFELWSQLRKSSSRCTCLFEKVCALCN